MQNVIVAIVLWCLCPAVFAGGLKRSDRFESPNVFSAALQALVPVSDQGEIGSLFSAKERGQPEDPKTGTPVPAKKIESCEVLWEGQDFTLVFATAAPPTEATRSAVGVLFLLKQTAAQWLIADFLRFTAIGRYPRISAELTAGTGSGYCLGKDGMMPVVTIKEEQGGRAHYYQLSASYTFAESHLRRVDLE